MENLESEKATMLTTHELSQWLRVKESTIRKWVCYDRIPYLKVGRLVVFQREDIQLWLERNNPKHERWSRWNESYGKAIMGQRGSFG